MLGNYLLMMFYTMVGGWMLNYAYQAATGKLQGLENAAIKENFDSMLASPKMMIFWMVLAVLTSLGVCALGLQNGVEKITKVMMSILIILMVVLALHSLTLEGAMGGVKFYLIPDFSAMQKMGIGSVVFAALTAGFIIIPSCFAYGVQPDAGPSLLFITLPNVFNHMQGGRIWATAFFVFMAFAFILLGTVFEIAFYKGRGR